MKNGGIIKEEENLLLSLCRLDFNEEKLQKIREHSSRVTDWTNFSHLANEHGVASLIWHNVEKLKMLSGIPDEINVFLRNANLRSLGRNTFNTEAMREALRALNSENIKTVILKGLALENTVYGNAGLRQMSDIDILITREECLKARNVLQSIGYESLPVKSVFHKLIIKYSGKHLPSLLKHGTSIEIHMELFGGKKNALTQTLYDTAYEVAVGGERTWFPGPMIFFLYLVRHLATHEINNESQLRLYTDLVVLLEKYNETILDPALITYASEADMEESLASHLGILKDYWGIEFPEWLNIFIGLWRRSDFNDKFIYFLSNPKGNSGTDRPANYRHIISEIPGFHRKLIYVLGDLFPSFTFMKNRYGCISNWKVLFYYPHRIGKLLWLFKGYSHK